MGKTVNLRLRDDRLIQLPKPAVMGVINVSPNSFYNPHLTIDSALHAAEKMVAEGASIIDVGGDATNPGVDIATDAPSAETEIERVVPLVHAIKKHFNVVVSVDTSRAEVMREAVAQGADMINDQRALSGEGALSIIAALKTPVCIMHFFNPIRQPGSSDFATLLKTIKHELAQAVFRCEKQGISRDRIIIDPGFGQGNYGKNTQENFYLLAHLSEFVDMGLPVLTGWSRKSMIGDVLGVEPKDRLYGSIAADTLATIKGAAIIRTHDVGAIVDAVTVASHVIAVTEKEVV